jgi:archaemetzincin
VVKEAIHELGHTFNLRHCQDVACVMHYCRSMKEVDRKSNQFCRYCAVLLEDEMRRLAKGALRQS